MPNTGNDEGQFLKLHSESGTWMLPPEMTAGCMPSEVMETNGCMGAAFGLGGGASVSEEHAAAADGEGEPYFRDSDFAARLPPRLLPGPRQPKAAAARAAAPTVPCCRYSTYYVHQANSAVHRTRIGSASMPCALRNSV